MGLNDSMETTMKAESINVANVNDNVREEYSSKGSRTQRSGRSISNNANMKQPTENGANGL